MTIARSIHCFLLPAILVASSLGCRSIQVAPREQDLSGEHPVFRWKRAPMAMSYHFQMAKEQNFDNLIVDEANLVSENFECYSQLPTDVPLYWRVKASDSLLLPNPWSETRKFLLLSSPRPLLPKSYTTGLLPEFLWEYDGPQDVSFTLQVSASPAFDPPLVEPTLKAKSFTYPVSLEYGRRYWWRVRARTQGEAGSWSEPVPFDLRPPAPVPVSPQGAFTGPKTVLQWKRVPGAEVYVVHVSENQEFSTVVAQERTADNRLDISNAVGFHRTYFWRVAAVAKDQPGEWSPLAEFTLEYPVPEPKLPGKGDNYTLTPLFAWIPCEGANRYEILVRSQDELAAAGGEEEPKGVIVPLNLNRFYVDNEGRFHVLAFHLWEQNLESSREYAWKVRALFLDGGRSAWSEKSTFFIMLESLDAEHSHLLTEDPFFNEMHPRISPEGDRVCYVESRWSPDVSAQDAARGRREGAPHRIRWKSLGFREDGTPFMGHDTSLFSSGGRGNCDLFPAWGPGNSIIYASDCLRTDGVGTDLILKDLSRPGVTILTDGRLTESFENPDLDSTRTLLCFTVRAKDRKPTIWVMDLKGQAFTEVVHGQEPSFSPDGRTIVYSSDKGDAWNIWVVDRFDGSPRRLTSNTDPTLFFGHPRFSRDGRKIAYASNKADNRDIYVIDVEGPLGEERGQITHSLAEDDYPDWLPGDRGLLFQSKYRGNGDWRLRAILFKNQEAGNPDPGKEEGPSKPENR